VRLACWTALFVLAYGPSASAKCSIPVVEISGRVLDESGEPHPGAVVAVAWEERKSIGGPQVATSDADGRFLLRFQFNTFTRSRLLLGEKCAERLDRVRISAQAGDEHAESRWIALTDYVGEVDLVLGADPDASNHCPDN
jgi:hypothetical protein